MDTTTRLIVAAALWALIAGAILAQEKPSPGPTVPGKTLPVPKAGEDLVLNPTLEECKAGWRRGMKWTKDEFDKLCTQLKISK